MREYKWNVERNVLSVCMENKDVNHILLSCPKTKELKMQFIDKK